MLLQIHCQNHQCRSDINGILKINHIYKTIDNNFETHE